MGRNSIQPNVLSLPQLYVLIESTGNRLRKDRLSEIVMLDFSLRCDRVNTVTIESCDENYVEIGLSGYWLSVGADLAEGVFVSQ